MSNAIKTGFFHKAITLLPVLALPVFLFSQDSAFIARWLDSANNLYNLGRIKQSDSMVEKYFHAPIVERNLTLQARSNIILGNIHYRAGDLSKAAQYAIEALKAFDKATNRKGSFSATLLLGNVHLAQKNYTLSKSYFSRALALAKEEKYDKGIGKSYLNLGMLVYDMKQTDSAIYYLNQSSSYFRQAKDDATLLMVYSNLGVIFFDKGDYKNALTEYKRAEAIALQQEDSFAIGTLKVNVGAAYLKLKRLGLAEKYLEDGRNISLSVGVKDVIAEANATLAELYKQQHRYKEAFQSLEASQQIKDSLREAQKNESIEALTFKYESEIKDKQILLLTQEKQTQSLAILAAKRQLNNQYLLAIIIVVVIAALAGFLFYRQKQKTAARFQEAERQKVIAELQALKAQLNPHLLFNSLNTIYFQVAEDKEAARETITKYADILRYQLYETDSNMVDLASELECLEKFVDIQKLRL